MLLADVYHLATMSEDLSAVLARYAPWNPRGSGAREGATAAAPRRERVTR